MSLRLWYPQLDVYDSIRRMMCVLFSWTTAPISPERLFMLDFYLASPALLYEVSMTQEIRERFQKLNVTPPSKEFLSYPSAPILFQRMEEIQRSALRTLAGKNLVEGGLLANNQVILSDLGRSLASQKFNALVAKNEREVLTFLTSGFGLMSLKDIRDMRRRTGLRRASR
jgi:hypothetical protein